MLKKLLTPLSPGSKRLSRKPGSVEIKEHSTERQQVGRQGRTFQILNRNTFFVVVVLPNEVLQEKYF